MANVEISNFNCISSITSYLEDAIKLIQEAKTSVSEGISTIPTQIKSQIDTNSLITSLADIESKCTASLGLLKENVDNYTKYEDKTNASSTNLANWNLLNGIDVMDAATLMSFIPKDGIKSMQLAVFSNGQVTSTSNFNTTDNALYPTSSCSKTILGIIAAKMQEDGIINLDENLEDYWHRAYYYDYNSCTPEWRSLLASGATLKDYTNPNRNLVENPATLRDTLTHSSTIKNMSMVYMEPNNHSSEYFGGSMSSNYGRAAFMLAHTYGQLFNQGQTPGTTTEYNRNNDTLTRDHSLAGLTMQVAMKQSVNEYLDQSLLTPLGINDNSGYKNGNSIYFATSYNSSATDMAKIVATVANNGVYDGKQILSPQTVSEIEKVYPNLKNQTIAFDYVDGKYEKYGSYSTISDPSKYGLSKDINNYSTYITYDPKTGQGYVINIEFQNSNYKNNSYNLFSNASTHFYGN